MSYLELLKLAAPETVIVLTALAVLVVDLVALRGLETRSRFLIGGHDCLRRLRRRSGVGCW